MSTAYTDVPVTITIAGRATNITRGAGGALEMPIEKPKYVLDPTES